MSEEPPDSAETPGDDEPTQVQLASYAVVEDEEENESPAPEVTGPPKDSDASIEMVEEEVTLAGEFRRLRDAVLSPFAELGILAALAWDSFKWGLRPPYRGRLFISSLEFIGVGSIFIVGLTGLFTGMVLGLQLVDSLRDFSAESQAGAIVGLGLTREIAPVFTALMVSSRAGSAITTELGSMRVTQQIDALEVMAVNPVQYLVVPRVIAGVVMVPVLTILFDVVGMFGAWAVCTELLGVDGGVFLARMQWMVDWPDVFQGVVKAAFFGAVVTLIACRHGFYASGGAAGVGRATNRSVVHNAIAVLAVDYVITAMWIGDAGAGML